MAEGWRLISSETPERTERVLLSIPGFCWGDGIVLQRLEDPHDREYHPLGCDIEIVEGLDYYLVTIGPYMLKLATHWKPLPEPPEKGERRGR